MSHITGGGFANNLARVLPDSVTARLDRASWRPLAIFSLIQQTGQIAQPDIEATLNMGVGMAYCRARRARTQRFACWPTAASMSSAARSPNGFRTRRRWPSARRYPSAVS